jgi:hypothetical protein
MHKPLPTVTTEHCGSIGDWGDAIMEPFSYQVFGGDSYYARQEDGSPTPFSYSEHNAFAEDEQPAMLEMPGMSGFNSYDTQLIGGYGMHDCCGADAHHGGQQLLRAPSALHLHPAPQQQQQQQRQHSTFIKQEPRAPEGTLGAALPAGPASSPAGGALKPRTPRATAPAEPAEPASPRLGRDQAVLVAKILTKSDASSKRVILPRVSVEANMAWIVGVPNYQLAVHDTQGREWRFVVKSWSNGEQRWRWGRAKAGGRRKLGAGRQCAPCTMGGTQPHHRPSGQPGAEAGGPARPAGENPKPVYVVEQISEYMRIHKLGPGDAVGILGDAKGRLTIVSNTAEVRRGGALLPGACPWPPLIARPPSLPRLAAPGRLSPASPAPAAGARRRAAAAVQRVRAGGGAQAPARPHRLRRLKLRHARAGGRGGRAADAAAQPAGRRAGDPQQRLPAVPAHARLQPCGRPPGLVLGPQGLQAPWQVGARTSRRQEGACCRQAAAPGLLTQPSWGRHPAALRAPLGDLEGAAL